MKTVAKLLNKFEKYRSTKLQSIELLLSTYTLFSIVSLIFRVLVRKGIIQI